MILARNGKFEGQELAGPEGRQRAVVIWNEIKRADIPIEIFVNALGNPKRSLAVPGGFADAADSIDSAHDGCGLCFELVQVFALVTRGAQASGRV